MPTQNDSKETSIRSTIFTSFTHSPPTQRTYSSYVLLIIRCTFHSKTTSHQFLKNITLELLGHNTFTNMHVPIVLAVYGNLCTPVSVNPYYYHLVLIWSRNMLKRVMFSCSSLIWLERRRNTDFSLCWAGRPAIPIPFPECPF